MYINLKNVEVSDKTFTIDNHLELEDYKVQLAKESYNLTSRINDLYLLGDDKMEPGVEGLISGTIDIIKKVIKGILDGIAAIFKFIGKMIKGIINFIKSLFGKSNSSNGGGGGSSASTIKSINKDDTKEEFKAMVVFEQVLKEEKNKIESKDIDNAEALIRSIYRHNKGFFLFIIEGNNGILNVDAFEKYLKSIFKIFDTDGFMYGYINELEIIINDLYKYLTTDYSIEDTMDFDKMKTDINEIYDKYNKIEEYLNITPLPIKLKDNILDKSEPIEIYGNEKIIIPILKPIKIDESKIGDITIDKTSKDYDLVMKEIQDTIIVDFTGKAIIRELNKLKDINDRISKKSLKEEDIKNMEYKRNDLYLLKNLIHTYEVMYKINVELSLFYNNKTIGLIIKEYLELSKS